MMVLGMNNNQEHDMQYSVVVGLEFSASSDEHYHLGSVSVDVEAKSAKFAKRVAVDKVKSGFQFFPAEADLIDENE